MTCVYRFNFQKGQYLPRAMDGRLTANFLIHLFHHGHYLLWGLALLAEVTIYPEGRGDGTYSLFSAY